MRRLLLAVVILAVMAMAFILSLLAAAITPFNFCAGLTALAALWTWGIAFRLARKFDEW